MSQQAKTRTGVSSLCNSSHELQFDVANSIDDVLEAWRLVYRAYRQIDIIDENPFALHTVNETMAESTTVITGRSNGAVASTLTMIHDSGGLPLDSVYKAELDQLRAQGRHLVEVGLLADRRTSISRAFSAMIGMMRFVYYQAYYDKSILLCGVHPHHAGFYTKTLGFKVLGQETTYPTVKNRPVVLLVGDLMEWLERETLPRRLVEFAENALPSTVFNDRFRLTPENLRGTEIEAFINWKQQTDATQFDVL